MYRIYLVTINEENNSSMSQDVTESITQLSISSGAHLTKDMIDFLDNQIRENNNRHPLRGPHHPYARKID